jgi:hypothetical protein
MNLRFEPNLEYQRAASGLVCDITRRPGGEAGEF